MMKHSLLIFSILLGSLSVWANQAVEPKPAAVNKRVPSLNWLPEGRCKLKKTIQVPGTQIHLTEFQIFTIRRGTGCKAGQSSTWWKKCDIRDGETDAGSDPATDVVIWYRDPDNYKRKYNIVFTMLKEVERRAFVDRHGNYLGFYETTARENLNMEPDVIHVVAKRQIPKASENKIVAELQIFKPGDKEKGIRSKLLHRERCEMEFTDKSF